jgi:DNA-binding transcriptional LysR family regulator
MNLYHLELFLAVGEEGSVTRGAERVGVSQPSVSRAVADLEQALGERLFDRGPKGVVLTEAGRVLIDYARRIFTLEQEAGEALTDLRGLESGTLSIGASTTIGDHLLPPVIAAFVASFPALRFAMEVANTEVIQAGVAGGRYDVGFTEGRVDASQFDVAVVAEDELVVFCAPSHPVARNTQTSIIEISQYPFVMRELGSGTRMLVESSFQGAGVVPLVACELGSTNAIKQAVIHDLGLGFASSLAIAGEVARGDLVIVKTPLTFNRQLHMIRLAWRGESAALRQFLRFLLPNAHGDVSLNRH